MRNWIRWTAVAGATLVAGAALAADHTDGPAVQMGQNASADINDVYAFTAADNNSLAMIMTVGGVGAAPFSSGFQYAFHVGRAGDAVTALTGPAPDTTTVICELDVVTDVSCWVVDSAGSTVDHASGDASDALVSDSGDLRVHAGMHADPFFFHLSGFNDARAFVSANFSAVEVDANGCPENLESIPLCNGTETAGGVIRGLLSGSYADASCAPGAASNPFASFNVNAIVVELDKSKIAGAGEYFQVWASTHSKN